MKVIKSVGQLLRILDSPCTFVELETETEPKRGIRKLSKVNCAVGDNLDYKSVVNRRKQKDGDFTIPSVKPRRWGIRVKGTPLVQHNNRQYLEVLKLNEKEEFQNSEGMPIDKEDAYAIMGKRKQQNTYGVTNPPKWRDYKIGSIKGITVNKQRFAVDIPQT